MPGAEAQRGVQQAPADPQQVKDHQYGDAENAEATSVASAAHCAYAWDTLCSHFFGARSALQPPTFDNDICPLFVSWHKASRLGGDHSLRGCIGTLEARPLHTAVRDYALTSALRDRRFAAIEAKELPLLRCTISLLSRFEPAGSWEDWEVGKHGLIIEFVDPSSAARRTATFLPEVAAHEGWDKQQTIDHLIRKAGYTGAVVTVRRSLCITRYQSTACSLTYEEYRHLKEAGWVGGLLHRLRQQQPLVTVSAAQ